MPAPGNATRAAELSVHDVRGRRVFTRVLDPQDGVAGFEWGGTDAAGRRLPPGTYFITARGAGGEATRRIVIAR